MRSTLAAYLLFFALMITAAWAAVPAVEAPPKLPIVFAWNYTPDPAATGVLRAVQAYVDFRTIPGDWSPRWENRRITFFVDGKQATTAQAAARLKVLPVLTWAHPYHWRDVAGAPEEFSPESVAAVRELVRSAKQALRADLTELRLRRIRHVTDFEGFADYAKPPVKAEAPFAVVTDHATTACYLFGEALRACSWIGDDGGAANYATCHAAVCPTAGGGKNRQTPAHVPASMDGRTTFLSGYTSGGPWGCLTADEVLDGLAKMPGPVWLALDDYQPGRDRIIRAAKAVGVEVISLWGTEKGVAGTAAADRSNSAWSKKQDQDIAAELGAE